MYYLACLFVHIACKCKYCGHYSKIWQDIHYAVLLVGIKSAPSVFLTVFIVNAKHKRNKMADVHNWISIPRQVCRPSPSGSLLCTIFVTTYFGVHSFICFCLSDKYIFYIRLFGLSVYMDGLLSCLNTWVQGSFRK